MRRLNYILTGVFSLFFLFSFIAGVQAKMGGDSTSYKFTGRLLLTNTTCVVNNNETINIPFGNVGINKVDSGQYIEDINYTLDCGSATDENTVTMMVKATAVDWDTKAMNSNVTGLGVRILSDSVPIELNKGININLGSLPHLQAQLVKDPDTELSEQDFNVVGSLVVEYQ